MKIKKVGNISPGNHHGGDVFDEECISPTVLCRDYKDPKKILLRNNTKKGYAEATDGDGIVINQYNCRGRVQPKSVPTLNTGDGSGCGVLIKDETKQGSHLLKENECVTLDNTKCRGSRTRGDKTSTLRSGPGCGMATLTSDYKIRKLTPIECEKLQGFPRNWTEEGADGSKISDTQRYKCCGNAVTTNVVRDIFDTWDMNFEDD